jgi:hypothetical protein
MIPNRQPSTETGQLHIVERVPAWLKNVALLRKVKHRGREKVDWIFVFALAAYNLVRMRNLEVAT